MLVVNEKLVVNEHWNFLKTEVAVRETKGKICSTFENKIIFLFNDYKDRPTMCRI